MGTSGVQVHSGMGGRRTGSLFTHGRGSSPEVRPEETLGSLLTPVGPTGSVSGDPSRKVTGE